MTSGRKCLRTVHISRIKIRHFRSIQDLELDLSRLTVICGPNSCGKSNVLRAVQFAFQDAHTPGEVYENLIATKRDQQGGPRLAMTVEMDFADCPSSLARALGLPTGATECTYTFTARRNGTVQRKLNDQPLDDTVKISDHIRVVYVPAIRDIESSGLQPFRRLFVDLVSKAKGRRSLRAIESDARALLGQHGDHLFANQPALDQLVERSGHVKIDVSALSLDAVFADVGLLYEVNGRAIPLAELGTGHQSAVIMHLYRMLGETMAGDTVFLFEEPDNHLHPSTIRSIGDDLRRISESAQVLVTSHSPILLGHLGYDCIRALSMGSDRLTHRRDINMSGYTDRQIRANLNDYGIRATEPLLCQRVIVVEGPSDATVIEELIELRYGVTISRLNALVVNAGGKDRVVRLCQLLTSLGTDWRAFLDWDACYVSNAPYCLTSLTSAEQAAATQALTNIESILDTSNKRGAGVAKGLRAVKDELANGIGLPVLFSGSQLEQLVRLGEPLAQSSEAKIRASLRSRKKTKYRPVLMDRGVWLWAGDIEDELLRNAGCEQAVYTSLVRQGVKVGPAGGAGQRRATLKGILKNHANDPLVLRAVVQDMEGSKEFARSDMNKAIKFIVDGLL